MILFLKRFVCSFLVLGQLLSPQIVYGYQTVSLGDIREGEFEESGKTHRIRYIPLELKAGMDTYQVQLNQDMESVKKEEVFFYSPTTQQHLGILSRNDRGLLLKWLTTPLDLALFPTSSTPLVIDSAGDVTLNRGQVLNYGLTIQSQNCRLNDLSCPQLHATALQTLTTEGALTSDTTCLLSSPKGVNLAQITARNGLVLEGSWQHRGQIDTDTLLAKGNSFSARKGASISVREGFSADVDVYSCNCSVQAKDHKVTGQSASLFPHFQFLGRNFVVESKSIQTAPGLKVEVDGSIRFDTLASLDVLGEYKIKASTEPQEFLAQSSEGHVTFGEKEEKTGKTRLELASGQAIIEGRDGYVYGQMLRTGSHPLRLVVKARRQAIIESSALLDDLYVHANRQKFKNLPPHLGTLHTTGRELEILPGAKTNVERLQIFQTANAHIGRRFYVERNTFIESNSLTLEASQNFHGKTFVKTNQETFFGNSGVPTIKIEDGTVHAGELFSATGDIYGDRLVILAKGKSIDRCPTLKLLRTEGDWLMMGEFRPAELETGWIDTLIVKEKKNIFLGASHVGVAHFEADSCSVAPAAHITRLKAKVGEFCAEALNARVAQIKADRDVMISHVRGETLRILAKEKCNLRDVTLKGALKAKAAAVSVDKAKTGPIRVTATQGDARVHNAEAPSTVIVAAKDAVASGNKTGTSVVQGANAYAFGNITQQQTHVIAHGSGNGQDGVASVSGQKGGKLTVKAAQSAHVRESTLASSKVKSGGDASTAHLKVKDDVSVKARDSATSTDIRAQTVSTDARDIVSDDVDAVQTYQGGDSVTMLGDHNKGSVNATAPQVNAHGKLDGSSTINANNAVITQDVSGLLKATVTNHCALTGHTRNTDITTRTNVGIQTLPSQRFTLTVEDLFSPQRMFSQDDSAIETRLTKTGTRTQHLYGNNRGKAKTSLKTNGDVVASHAHFHFEQGLAIQGRDFDFRKAHFNVGGPLTRGATGKADYSHSQTHAKGRVTDVTEGTGLYDHAKIRAGGNASVFTNKGELVLQVADIEGEDVHLGSLSGGPVRANSQAVRHGGGDNYSDSLDSAKLHARGTLTLQAGEKGMVLQAVHMKSGRGMRIESSGPFQDLSVPLASQQTTYFDGGFDRSIRVHQATSVYQSGGKVAIRAGGMAVLDAPTIKAPKCTVEGDQGTHCRAVYDSYTHESQHTSTSGGLFGMFPTTTTTHCQSASSTGRGAIFDTQNPVEVGSNGNVTLQAVSAPGMNIHAPKGQVTFAQVQNTHSSSQMSHSSNLFCQTQEVNHAQSTTHHSSQISDKVNIHAKGVVVEEVAGQTLAFLKNLNTHGAPLTFKQLQDHYEVFHQRHWAPTPELMAVVSLAVTLASYGTASGLSASLVGSMALTGTTGLVVSAGATAAMVTASSQAAIALLQNEGNILKAAQSLASTQSLQAIGVSALTAGATAGLGGAAGVSATKAGFGDRLTRTALGAGVSMGIRIAQGEDIGSVLKTGLTTIVTTVASGAAANAIGDAYALGDLNALIHKLTHGIVGGATAAAIGLAGGDDVGRSAASGAMGAIVAETIAEALPASLAAQTRADLGVLISAGLAFGTGLDPNLAALTGTTAVQNNFLLTEHLYGSMGKDDFPGMPMGGGGRGYIANGGTARSSAPPAAAQNIRATAHSSAAAAKPSAAGPQATVGAPKPPSAQPAAASASASQPSSQTVTRFSSNARAYVRDMATRSGIPIASKQRLSLKDSLQQTSYKKLTPAEALSHSKQYTRTKAEALKKEWTTNTQQPWPTTQVLNPKSGKMEPVDHQLHHIIPQQVGGPHEWWNAHPVAQPSHQGGIHGKGSALQTLLKDIKE